MHYLGTILWCGCAQLALHCRLRGMHFHQEAKKHSRTAFLAMLSIFPWICLLAQALASTMPLASSPLRLVPVVNVNVTLVRTIYMCIHRFPSSMTGCRSRMMTDRRGQANRFYLVLLCLIRKTGARRRVYWLCLHVSRYSLVHHKLYSSIVN